MLSQLLSLSPAFFSALDDGLKDLLGVFCLFGGFSHWHIALSCLQRNESSSGIDSTSRKVPEHTVPSFRPPYSVIVPVSLGRTPGSSL